MQVRAVMPFRNVFQSVPWGVAMHFLQWICHLTAMFLTEILYMYPGFQSLKNGGLVNAPLTTCGIFKTIIATKDVRMPSYV